MLFLKNRRPLLMDCWNTFLALVRATSPLAFDNGIMHAIAGNLEFLECFSFTLLALKLHGDNLATFSDQGNLPVHIMAVKPGRRNTGDIGLWKNKNHKMRQLCMP
jgi:phosphoheptose isomerase